MKNLQEATERICELKGGLVAMDVLLSALIAALPPSVRADLQRLHGLHAEAARTALLHVDISEHTISAFEQEVRRTEAMLAALADTPSQAAA